MVELALGTGAIQVRLLSMAPRVRGGMADALGLGPSVFKDVGVRLSPNARSANGGSNPPSSSGSPKVSQLHSGGHRQLGEVV